MRNLAEILFPSSLTCLCCDAVTWGASVCPECTALLEDTLRMPADGCPACGGELDADGVCSRCTAFGVLHARSVWKHTLAARSLVHQLKFQNIAEAALPMIAAMAKEIQALHLPEDTWITYVAMPKHRLRERGIDHTRLLAEGIAKELQLPCRNVLQRVHDKKLHTQQGLTGMERAKNVQNTFICRETLQGTVLLIDDVLTTGATAKDCERALLAAGATQMIVVTATRGGQND